MASTAALILAQIDSVLAVYESAKRTSEYEDLADHGDTYTSELITRLAATIDRLSPPGSQYRESADTALREYGVGNAYNIPILAGALKALRADYAAGYLQRVEDIVHADVFSDFLDMADHLLTQGYKDPAAVLIGGVLEEHLRKLCLRHAVSITNGARLKTADGMNADLANAGVYNKLDQKHVIAWLDLRNKAAHAKYGEYTKEQVQGFLQGVRDFAARNL